MNKQSQAHDFAALLRQRRVARELSLSVLADRVGCAKSYLSSIENGHKGPPTDSIIERLEDALGFTKGELSESARWDQTPEGIRKDIEQLRAREQSAKTLAKMLTQTASGGASLDDLYASGELQRLIDRIEPSAESGSDPNGDREDSDELSKRMKLDHQLASLPMQVPIMNKVTAGYPAEFTDMGYPAGIADEYVQTPDLRDPDAFAARVVGDSMEPVYREGDIVIFSPIKKINDGMDCFVRLEPDHESTFKRIYFQKDEDGNELIRIQPINNAYPSRTLSRDQVAGLYAGVSVMRSIG